MRYAITVGILGLAAAVATPALAFNPQPEHPVPGMLGPARTETTVLDAALAQPPDPGLPASGAELSFPDAPALKAGGLEQFCWQDQYGNQWDFTYDTAHRNMYGTVHLAQTCTATEFPLTGSYWGGSHYELTAANPEGDDDLCDTIAMIKGTYPKGAWYYETGYGEQAFTWAPCGAEVRAGLAAGGLTKSR